MGASSCPRLPLPGENHSHFLSCHSPSFSSGSLDTYLCGGWDTMWVLAHSFLTGNFTPKKKSYTSACIIVYDINIVFIVNSELAIEKGKMRGSEEKIHNNRTGFWPKGWAGLQMLSQTIRLSVFGLPSVANFSITFCCPPPCFFLSLLPSKGAIIVAAISNNITIRGSSDGSLLQTYCRWTSYFH